MADILQFGNPGIDAHLQQYYDDIDALVLLALSGRINEQTFRQELEALARAALTFAFLLGGGDSSTGAAQVKMSTRWGEVQNSINVLADDIFSGRYSARTEAEPGKPEQTAAEGLEKLRERLAGWVYTVGAAYNLGVKYRRPAITPTGQIVERLFRWDWTAGKDHCGDCASLNGTIMTAAEWDNLAAVGLEPQSPSLECGGWRCGCQLTDVTFEQVQG